MRVLADENVPEPIVAALREQGHDVLYAQESLPKTADRIVLARAQEERRIVVTLDTDLVNWPSVGDYRQNPALFSSAWNGATLRPTTRSQLPR